MSDPASNYECLAKSRFGLAGVGSLWMGADHLVLVSNVFAVETYRRWYFKDIQALIARRTARRLVWNLVVGFGLLALGLGAAGCFISAGSDTGSDRQVAMVMGVILGILAAGCLLIVVVNSVMGPGCVVSIQTPFGLDRMSIPGRMPAFEKIAARLQPLIEASQARPEPAGTTAGESSLPR